MAKGIVRKLDELGRATLPKEFRTTLGIKEHDKLDIYLDGKRICIEAAKKCSGCEAHGTDKELIKYKDTYLCNDCLKGFVEAAK